MRGDPTRIYLNVRLGPAGGAVLALWGDVLQIWEVAFRIAEALAVAGGVIHLYEKVRDRLAGYQVAASKSEEWLKRNGYPDYLHYMLRGQPWVPRDLAGLLGCTTQEAEQFLALHGYDPGAAEEWVYVGGDEVLGLPVESLSARIVTAYTREASYRSHARLPDEFAGALFEEIVKEAAEKGEVTGLRYDEHGHHLHNP